MGFTMIIMVDEHLSKPSWEKDVMMGAAFPAIPLGAPTARSPKTSS